MIEECWLTVQDIVDLLSVHEQTVRRWLRTRQPTGYNFGGRIGWRGRASSFDELIELHNRAASAA